MKWSKLAPNKLTVFDYEFEITTNANVWREISCNFSNQSNNIDSLLKTVKNIHIADKEKSNPLEYQKIIDRLIEKLIWFLGCGIETKTAPTNNKKLYDFEKDKRVIFSAFLKTYNINIEHEIKYMDWWEFIALFNDLDDDTMLKSYYYKYRGYDTSSKEFKDLPAKRKTEIIQTINEVALDKSPQNKVMGELEKRHKQAKLEKELEKIINGG